MPENIHIRAYFIIEKDNVEQFKKLIREMSEVVETNEPDTSEYRFYLNEDGTKCIVHETYADSKATLSHNDGAASKTILQSIFNAAQLNRLDVYGNPNDEWKKVLAGLNSHTFNLFTGFSWKNK
jgi:quinol monooxygenase YgiN